jgi:phenylpyruvate tautomerase PptA (4-oxalocrotonate tautomerase family)
MGQIKIYAHAVTVARYRDAISGAVHRALVDAFAYPPEKRFQRFLPLEEENFLHPADRTRDFLIIEVLLFPGRSPEAKKAFYRNVLANLQAEAGIEANDVEIVLIEVPQENWSIRGVPGDELKLTYRVDV